MKRIFTFAFVLILLFAFFPATTAVASADESEYLEIDRANVYLYEDTAIQSQMFVIPRTFYVRIIKKNYDKYYKVEYNGVEGLVLISAVSGKIVKDVENPYYTARQITAHTEEYLYTAPSFEAKSAIKASGTALPYLGKTQGEKGTYNTATWFAVLYAGKVYYIHAAKTADLDLLESSFAPVHPNSVASASATEDAGSTSTASTEEKKGSSFDTVRLLLILGMIVPLLIIIFLLFRPRRRRRITYSSDRDRRSRDEDEYDDY